MSKKAQKRRGPRPPRPTPEAKATAAVEAARSRARARRLLAAVGGLVLVAVVAVGVVALASRPADRPAATSSPSQVAAASPSAAPSTASTIAPGGKVAQALVNALHADPFVAHVEETVLARSVTNAIALNLTAKATGDVAGRNVSIRTTSSGGGPPTDQEIVAVGDAAWTRATGAAAWRAHPRTDVASAVDGLLTTIRLLDDPTLLVDSGIETVAGRALHHLTGVGPITDPNQTGDQGTYDTFDVWATDAGIPVLMKATFVSSAGANSLTGSVEIRYSKVGGPITIAPPSGAPTVGP